MFEPYVLYGFFRFIQSDKPGVVGEVVSARYGAQHANDSDVALYIKVPLETKKDLVNEDSASLCGDYPAPCNCNNPEIHDGH